jgi:hypothetical protein
MPITLWFPLVIVFAGQMCWLLSAEAAKKWLITNDPTFQKPGLLANAFLGRLITSFGPMARYNALRRERNEPNTLVLLFWGGFGTSMIGLVFLLAGLARI